MMRRCPVSLLSNNTGASRTLRATGLSATATPSTNPAIPKHGSGSLFHRVGASTAASTVTAVHLGTTSGSLRFCSSTGINNNNTTPQEAPTPIPVEGDYDVAIVGCGMLGACLALHLTRAGYKVAVIDQKCGPGDGTTSYSTGLVRAFYSTYDVSAIAWEAYQKFLVWKDFLRLGQNVETAKMRIAPCVIPQINGEDDSFMKKAIPICEKLNIPFERMTVEEMKATLSKINWDCDNVYTPRSIEDEEFDTPDTTKAYSHAFKFPCTAYFSDPRQVVIDIVNATKDPANHGTDALPVHLPINHVDAGKVATGIKGDYRGAPTYFFKSLLKSITKTKNADGSVAVDGVVISDNCDTGVRDRKLNARIVVNCSGPWSNKVTPLAFDGAGIKCDNNVTTRPLRIEFAVLKQSEPAKYNLETDGVVLIDNDLGFYSRPEPGNRVLVGGIEAACDAEEYFEDASDAETAITSDIWKTSVYRAALRTPALDVPTGRSAIGGISSYDVTEDWNPILDRSNMAGYYQAIGTSGNCFKTAPVMTKMLSELIIKEDKGIMPRYGEQCHDLAPMKSHLETINVEVSLGTFSRLRSVEGASTKNVFA